MNFKYFKKKFYFDFFLIIFIFFIDRISKIYVINFSEKNNTSEIFSSKFLNFHLIWNEGIAFGLFSFDEFYLYNTVSIIILIIILVLLIMIFKSHGLKKYSFILIFGGALGNFYDRLFYKAVPDFIDFHINNFHWFIFNIADIFITTGVIFVILCEIIGNNSKIDEKNY